MSNMRCAIVTFSRAINYGAVLQMYALQSVINRFDRIECDVVDYRSELLEKEYETISIKRLLNPKVLASVLLHNSYIRFNKSGFSDFCSKYIVFSQKSYFNPQSLSELNDIYDVFITGSDQVFNLYCSHFDKSYFLDFVSDGRKKNSYAASLGLERIPDGLEGEYSKLLESFKNISVREETAAKEIERVTGKKCTVNIDPTLLLRDEWKGMISLNRVPDIKYVLVFGISEDKKLFKLAKRIAKRKKCEIIYISDRLLKPYGINRYKNVNPNEWLGLIQNAEAVVTNSYHGILFSCNFHKELYPVLLHKNIKVNSRITDFLSCFDLNELLVLDDLNIDNSKFSFDKFDDLLKEESNNSRRYLEGVFHEAEIGEH